jgi:hypothetical protein
VDTKWFAALVRVLCDTMCSNVFFLSRRSSQRAQSSESERVPTTRRTLVHAFAGKTGLLYFNSFLRVNLTTSSDEGYGSLLDCEFTGQPMASDRFAIPWCTL